MRNNGILMMAAAMLIFGTIGIFRKYIPLSSEVLACARGFLGGTFLLLCLLIKNKAVAFNFTKPQFLLLCFTGLMLGSNWILLFEAYNYTSIAVATLCYYMAPTIVILLSPFVFGERLTAKKMVCVVIALLGIALVSGVLDSDGVGDLRGVLFGLGAAVLYAAIVILNKKYPIADVYGKTIVQLYGAGILLVPYLFFTSSFTAVDFDGMAIVMLLIVGIIHTGIAYALYFGSLDKIKSQTVAMMSYIDPIFAILLAALLLQEPMTTLTLVGAVMVIGSAFISERV